MSSFINIPERLLPGDEELEYLRWQMFCELRVAIPGIIQSFDATKQTATVQIAIKEKLKVGLIVKDVDIDVLRDVPICTMRAGAFAVTIPVQAGDECLLIFGDACIDGWWQSGGMQTQMDRRRHDLSDAFAIVGIWNQKRVLQNYSTNALQIRTEDGTVLVELQNDTINITAPTVNVNASDTVTIQGSNEINVEGGVVSISGSTLDVSSSTVTISGTTSIQSIDFLSHTHTGVMSGGSISGPVSS